MEYKFPEHYPKQCPPFNARAVEITLYRMVKNNPLTTKDFLCHRLLYPNIEFSDPCEACGLSTYSSIDGAYKLQQTVPKFKKYKIAYGNIKPDNGPILETSSRDNPHHVTWWVALGIDAKSLFCVNR